MHIVGSGNFSTAGWRRAINIENNGTIAFLKDPGYDNHFFMGSPSIPGQDFYFGTVPVLSGGPVVYTYQVFGQNNPAGLGLPGSAERASARFYTNTYFVAPPDQGDSYVGVNTLEPKRVMDIVDNDAPQLRLTFAPNDNPTLGIYCDFQMQPLGLNITPIGLSFFGSDPRKPVYIHNGGTTINQDMLIVNGDARLRYVPVDPSSESLILGKQIGGNPDDISFRRLEFTGNPNEVLLGNGTWGTVPPSGFGAACSDPPGAGDLQFDTKVGMNDFTLYFEDGPSATTAGVNRVAIGYLCTDPLIAKLNVDNSSEDNGIYVQTSSVSSGTATGIRTESVSTNSGLNVGVWSNANGGNGGNVAYLGMAQNSGGNVAVTNMGGRFAGFGATFSNWGLSGSASGSVGSENYGLYGTANGDGNNYGVYGTAGGTGPINYAGYFNGPIYVNGTVIPSDQNMKTNISDYDSSLYVISQLEPKTFTYSNANFQGMNLPDGHQYGLIAQEVENVIPSIVTNNVHPAEYDSLGNQINPAYNFKGINYESFIPILIGGVKEQQQIIESQDSVITVQDSLITDLNDRLSYLENCLSALLPTLCEMNNTMILQNDENTQNQIKSQLNIILSDRNNIVLDQNVPNPFAEQTVINFVIPGTVQKAQIHFYDQNGQLIKSVDVDERGAGQLTVYAQDLSSGIYTYTLVADGEIVATKKMVKTK